MTGLLTQMAIEAALDGESRKNFNRVIERLSNGG